MLKKDSVEARAILLPNLAGGKKNQCDEMEMEEYEFDILWDERKQLWVANLIAGNYLINVKA
jgi:hypothetical protein